MRIAERLYSSDAQYLEDMSAYIERLRSMPAEQAKEEAKEALKRTGVLDEQGRPKEKIVSWE